jgi:proteasome lid subunit RPN8/RPN11
MENIILNEDDSIQERSYTKEFMIDKSVYERFLEFTRKNSQIEWGGVLLGKYTEDRKFIATVAIIPPQSSQNSVSCQFQREFFVALSNLRSNLESEGFDQSELLEFGCWIHTHPNLTAFLSATDRGTFLELTKFNPMLTAMVLDPVQRDEICVNSLKNDEFGFKPIEIKKVFLRISEADNKLFQSIEKEFRKESYKKLLKVNKTMKVFTPVGEFECLFELMDSKFQDLTKKIKTLSEKTLLSANNPHRLDDLKKQLPQLKEINLDDREYISSYKITSSGIIFNQIHDNNPHAYFIPWDKIKSIYLQANYTYILDLLFIVKKGFLRSEEKKIAFFTQQPNELISNLARFVGYIGSNTKKENPEKEFQDKENSTNSSKDEYNSIKEESKTGQKESG